MFIRRVSSNIADKANTTQAKINIFFPPYPNLRLDAGRKAL
jgi:hypothetical protein